VKDIREFFGVLTAERAHRGIFATTGAFTRDALSFAAGKTIEMIDGTKLGQLIRESSLGPDDDMLNVRLWAPVFLSGATVTTPDCPFCKTPMIKLMGRAGTFWGCRSYPRCRGNRQVRQYFENCSAI
jgi:restriction system protein